MVQNCAVFLSFDGVLSWVVCHPRNPTYEHFFFPWLRMCREYETINHKHKVIIIGCLYNVFLLALTGGRLSSLYTLNLRFEQPTWLRVNRPCFGSWSYGTYHPATRTNKHQLNWVMSDNHPKKGYKSPEPVLVLCLFKVMFYFLPWDSSLLNHHLRNMFLNVFDFCPTTKQTNLHLSESRCLNSQKVD